MNRVEPKAVEVVVDEPHERAFDPERANGGLRKVDGGPPGRMAFRIEKVGSGRVEVGAVGSEVIHDDVEYDHHARLVSALDEGLEVIGRAVGRVRREGENAVIPPAALAGPLAYRHDLDRRYSQSC